MTLIEALELLTPATKLSILKDLKDQGLEMGTDEYMQELESQVWDEVSDM